MFEALQLLVLHILLLIFLAQCAGQTASKLATFAPQPHQPLVVPSTHGSQDSGVYATAPVVLAFTTAPSAA